MSWGWWVLIIGTSWVVVGTAVALIVGRAISVADELARCTSKAQAAAVLSKTKT